MLDAIIESFTNLTPMLWVSQICGLIGLVIIGISYLFKKKTFLCIATVSFVFFVLEQIFAGLYANMIVSTTCLIRNSLMLVFLCKKDSSLPRWCMIALLAIMWSALLVYLSITQTFSLWENYLPASIVTMSTITQNRKNEYVVKLGATLHEFGFLIYYLVYSLPFSILRQVILVVACFIGFILLFVKRTKKEDSTSKIDTQ